MSEMPTHQASHICKAHKTNTQKLTLKRACKYVAAFIGLQKTSLSHAIDLTLQERGYFGFENGYDAAYHFSMGWNIWKKKGRIIYWKDGTSFGARSFLCFDKANKSVIVILSNTNNPINDIGLMLMDSNYSTMFRPYLYSWVVHDTVLLTIKQNGVEEGIKLYLKLKATKNSNNYFTEVQLDFVAGDLVKEKKNKEVIKIYELNRKEYPESNIVYESLGELFNQLGNTKEALVNFEKLVTLDPANAHGIWMVNRLKSKAH